MTWSKGLAKKNIFKVLSGRVRFEEPLKKHTTFKIGGRAQFFIEPADSADLKSALVLAKRYKIPVFVIGAGSNILISSRGVDGMILHLNSPFFKGIYNKKDNCLNVGSGLTLRHLIREARERSLSGVEFLVGIPGTVGGALAMNAGSWGKNIADLLERAAVMDYNGNVKILNKKDIKFGYRKSSLAKYIILNANFKLAKKNKAEIKENIKRYLEYRRNTQDTSLPNAGCIFKNPHRKSAGRLIDLCGLKGKSIGGACVSRRHANFILNRKHACSYDVLRLIDLIKKRVKLKFNIELEPEIKIWQ
jgi:UDP-N-acetylmuramate dehydrogenase